MSRCKIATTVLGCLLLASSAVAEQPPGSLEVRFCGPQALRAYPLSGEMGLRSVLLPFVAVINHGDDAIELAAIEVALLRDHEIAESRRLGRAELEAFGKISQQIQAAPIARESLALFCGDHLVPKAIALGSTTLAPRQGLLILNQTLAFDGQRDSLRVRATVKKGTTAQEANATLPISTAAAVTQYRLPVKGAWLVKSGPSFHTHHRWARPSEFALDLVKFGPEGRSHAGDGSRFADYYAYGEEIFAAAGGRVIRAVNDRPEPTDLLARNAETFAAYSQRTAGYVQTLLAAGIDGVTGNHVMIDHGNGEYSLYAHLQPGSVRVRVGDEVKSGDPLAKLGGSGNALIEPHLHFHVCDQPSPLTCAGIPVEFTDVEKPFVSFAPRAVQSGDIVIAK